MSGWRHPALGGEIHRDHRLTFTFDGKRYRGFEGDTLASALLAEGPRLIGRSFKYHRPRGIWGHGGEEPNALFDVTINGVTTPNQRATLIRLRDGMALQSVNTVPTAARDRRRIIDRVHRYLPAGFYYKTFMALGWMRWEPMIRRIAGLGRVDPENAPPADTTQINAHCDLLVIGAGPAGLAAAKAAAEQGREVWLVDEAAAPGGSMRWRGGEIDGAHWEAFAQAACEAVENAGGRVFTDTTVWGAFDHNLFAAWQRREEGRDALWRIRADDVILAAGAIERPMWFANNDLPGVMSAEAALAQMNLFGAVAGRRILLATGSDPAYATARALAEAGAEVTVADIRAETPKIDGVRVLPNARIRRAIGRRCVTGAEVGHETLSIDTILVSGGFTPSVHLWCQAGGKLDFDERCDGLIPREGTAAMKVVGAANGVFDLTDVLQQGHAAADGEGGVPLADAARSGDLAAIRPDPSIPGRQWIDYQNDVTLKDIGLAAREGYRSVEHLKRYTTLGMATDQGRSSNFAGLAAMSAITGLSIPETGTTTYRPPFRPVPFTILGGAHRSELYHPLKRLVLEDEHRARGARFREYGGWLRPSAFGAGDEEVLIQDEARVARSTVCAFDASSLGKLEVIGPDAAALLDFTGYVPMSTLKPGRARYGFMLSEDGIVYDDGVVLRLDENRFIVSASSSHVAGVHAKLEDARQDRIGKSGVFIHDVTGHWATLTVSGPKARDLLKAAELDIPELAHMGVAETTFEGELMRVARISFTGDQSYEMSVPQRLAKALHARLDAALPSFDGRWIGLEAVSLMRAEKGYILIGKDTDGATMPHDIGWVGPRNKREDEFIGKRALFLPEAKSETRRQLVGIEAAGGQKITTGAHFVPLEGNRRSLGFVTSSYHSPVLGRWVALGLLENGRALMGEEVGVYNDGGVARMKVASLVALDPEGARLHG